MLSVLSKRAVKRLHGLVILKPGLPMMQWLMRLLARCLWWFILNISDSVLRFCFFDSLTLSTQEKLFKVAGVPMVENCVAGYNSCMFAYGQVSPQSFGLKLVLHILVQNQHLSVFVFVCFLCAKLWYFGNWHRLAVVKHTLCLEISKEELEDTVSTVAWLLESLSTCFKEFKRFVFLIIKIEYAILFCILTSY